MAKVNGKQLLSRAEESGQIYPIKSSWKKYLIGVGIFMCLIVLGLPFGIWFFFVGARARIGLTDEGFAVRWFGTRAYAWDQIEAFQPVSLSFVGAGGGLVGALAMAAASSVVSKRTQGLKGPLSFKLKNKRAWIQIPAHAVQNSEAMAREMERHTGLTILPDGEPKAAASAA